MSNRPLEMQLSCHGPMWLEEEQCGTVGFAVGPSSLRRTWLGTCAKSIARSLTLKIERFGAEPARLEDRWTRDGGWCECQRTVNGSVRALDGGIADLDNWHPLATRYASI